MHIHSEAVARRSALAYNEKAARSSALACSEVLSGRLGDICATNSNLLIVASRFLAHSVVRVEDLACYKN